MFVGWLIGSLLNGYVGGVYKPPFSGPQCCFCKTIFLITPGVEYVSGTPLLLVKGNRWEGLNY